MTSKSLLALPQSYHMNVRLPQFIFYHHENKRLVIDNDYLAHRASLKGISGIILVPPPSILLISIVTPCSINISLNRENPNPVLLFFPMRSTIKSFSVAGDSFSRHAHPFSRNHDIQNIMFSLNIILII